MYIILNILLLLINFYLIYKTNKKKNIYIEQNNLKYLQLQDKKKQLSLLDDKKKQYELYIKNSKNQLDLLHNQQYKLNEQLSLNKNNIKNYYNDLKIQAKKSFQNYNDELDKYYQNKEFDFMNQISILENKTKQYENSLSQIKSTYQAAIAARLRQQEEKNKKRFYQIQITENQINDINTLLEWKHNLYQPSIVSKIIWSSYILKPTSDMCNRVLGTSSICGIYKITNLITNDTYIGQSNDIATRWKAHIKCGLGIDAPATNKLYINMQEYGVWNFTFELLQKCSKDKLNEKQRFWIEMYQSDKFSLNSTKGNK